MGATPREARPLRAPPTPGAEPGQRLAHQHPCRGVEQRQLVGLITQRSGVRIPPPATSSIYEGNLADVSERDVGHFCVP